MIKTVIAPIQQWLMSKGQCPGCGRPLSRAQHSPHQGEDKKAVCKCGRIFIFQSDNKQYRRALFEEV